MLDSTTISPSSSSEKLATPSISCVNVKSVVSSGCVSLTIVIVPFLIMLVNVQVTVSSGLSSINAVRSTVEESCALSSTQLTDWL